MVRVGDRIRVESRHVGQGAREGVVVETHDPLIKVHWMTGEETEFVPSAGSMTVVSSPNPPTRDMRRPS